MPSWKLQVHIDDAFRGRVKGALLRRAAASVLEAHSALSPREVSLAVVGDDEMRRLNRTSRGLDEGTDVLSFSLETGAFPLPHRGAPPLGEVVVSYPQAERQAPEMGHSVDHEISALVIHGVLHLLGYDHEVSEADAEAMRKAEAEAQERLWEEQGARKKEQEHKCA